MKNIRRGHRFPSESADGDVDLAVVCYFNSADIFAGGAERYAWGEAELFSATREVAFISASPPMPGSRLRQLRLGSWTRFLYQPPGPRRNPLKLVALHLLNLFNPGVFVESLRLFRRLQPTIVHTHNLLALSPAIWLSARLAGAKVIHTHQDLWLLCERATMTDAEGRPCNESQLTCVGCRALRQPKKLLAGNIDVEIFPSRWLRERLRRIGPLVPSFATSAPPVGASAEVTPPTALYVGALTPHKLGATLEAFRIALASVPELRLVIAGAGPLEAQVQQAAETSRAVTYMGPIDSPTRDRLLQAATVLLIPSTWEENSPLVFFEALAAGVPVIASDIGGVTELQKWGTMLLVPPGDAEALAESIAALVTDEAKLAALRSNGIEHRTEALPERFVERMEDVFAALESSN